MKAFETNNILNATLAMRILGIYLGTVLLMISLTVLAIQQLSDSIEHKSRFNVLKKLGVEDNNIAPPWLCGHYLLYNNKVIEPLFDSRKEYGWLYQIACRLGLEKEWSQGRNCSENWLEYLYQELREKDHPFRKD